MNNDGRLQSDFTYIVVSFLVSTYVVRIRTFQMHFKNLPWLFICVSCSQLSSSLECGRGEHGQDMHTELEMYASKLAEAEHRQRAMSTPDLLVCFLL